MSAPKYTPVAFVDPKYPFMPREVAGEKKPEPAAKEAFEKMLEALGAAL